MPNLSLDLSGIADQKVRDNMQKIQDFANGLGVTPQSMQAAELFVTDNQSKFKLDHSLGSVPLDVLITRLIAPSSAKLILRYSDFTSSEIFVDVTGLTSGQTLSARLLLGTLPDVVTVGDVKRADVELQEVRSKF